MLKPPNLNDPRIQRRCWQALAYARRRFGTRPRECSNREMARYFGNMSRNPGQWLRHLLVVEVNRYFNASEGVSKEYILNPLGFVELQQHLGITTEQLDRASVDQTLDEHRGALESGDFDYVDKSHRLWHPLQWIRSDIRSHVFADCGWQYSYDIRAAAPSMLMQRAQDKDPELDLPALAAYIANRDSLRHRITRLTGHPYAIAKTVVNALVCGAHLNPSPKASITRLLGNSRDVRVLKEDPVIVEFCQDIAKMWRVIFQGLPQRTNEQGRRLPRNSRERWAVYFQLEREVLDVTRRFLRSKKIKPFLIHDGFILQQGIDVMQLETYIRNQTGMQLTIEFKTLKKIY